VNGTLAESPEKLNQDPHGDAWLVKIKMASADEIKELLNAEEYQAYVGAE
jgi:glycine cleavage system H protein